MTQPHHTLAADSRTLDHIETHNLIRRFTVKQKNKVRTVNDPTPELKTILKTWNDVITAYYAAHIVEKGVADIPHAYLPHRSIQSNAARHLHSPIIQFDFKGFYDSCRYDYFKEHLAVIDPDLHDEDHARIARLVIDPETGGVTQGLPVSGALAGLSLVPFWVELKRTLPENIRFTQYSDDLTFSYTGREPEAFTIPRLTQFIYEALHATGLVFKLHPDKTRKQRAQYRKVTGVRINHRNQMTPSRSDYRFLRHALHVLKTADDLDHELKTWGFASRAAFVGKISYMRSIDTTGKIDRLILNHKDVCEKHDLFATWISNYYKQSAFA